MTRRITDNISEEALLSDLEKLRQKALELGASQVEIIPADRVIIDERVRAKCLNPKCPTYGTCGNCPPYAPDLDFIRKIAAKYRYALFILTRFPAEHTVTEEHHPLTISGGLKSHEIIAKVEAAAFHEGYYLAMGLGAGSCKPVFCPDSECSVLKGKECRQGLKARYSMESWGMDAFLMAARAGWEIYPGGKSDVPFLVTLGLVFIY
jgi:predicted metal-binding protein